ncbi:glycerol-3-phosphate dehydrogenase SDP6, mitochondrial [Tanacetum coccineum]
MDTAAAKHLSHSYGTKGENVAAITQISLLGDPRFAFLDTDAAGRVLTRVIEILASEHKWDKQRQKQEFESATSSYLTPF